MLLSSKKIHRIIFFLLKTKYNVTCCSLWHAWMESSFAKSLVLMGNCNSTYSSQVKEYRRQNKKAIYKRGFLLSKEKAVAYQTRFAGSSFINKRALGVHQVCRFGKQRVLQPNFVTKQCQCNLLKLLILYQQPIQKLRRICVTEIAADAMVKGIT